MASSSTSIAKCSSKSRQCVVLSLDDKLAILDHLKSGKTREWLAAEYGVGRSMIGDIKKEDKLRSFATTMESLTMSSKGRNVMRLADDEKLDKAVYLWFVQKRSQDMPISGGIL